MITQEAIFGMAIGATGITVVGEREACINMCMNQAAEASFIYMNPYSPTVTLLVTFMFADAKKFRSPMFIVNYLNLLIGLIEAIAIIATYDQVSFNGLGQWTLYARVQM